MQIEDQDDTCLSCKIVQRRVYFLEGFECLVMFRLEGGDGATGRCIMPLPGGCA